jgi:hypothetical protein
VSFSRASRKIGLAFSAEIKYNVENNKKKRGE